jgi:AcrR family transcriptional regulator
VTVGLRERKKLQTWRDIRTASLRLFEEHGFETVSVEQIADAAGVSRATFFNYFHNKEAVVFDPDPQQTADSRKRMTERPAGEPLWAALSAVILGFTQEIADVMVVQKRLRAASPVLANCAHDVTDRFAADLHTWAAERTGGSDQLRTTLTVNVALAAAQTAYALWDPDDGSDVFLKLLRSCLNSASKGPSPQP